MAGRLKAAQVAGRSMAPTLRAGDLVLFDTTARSPKIGDIVVFPGLVHRLIWIDPLGGLWHCGDRASAWPDRQLSSNLLGTVVAVARGTQWLDLDSSPPPKNHRTQLRLAMVIARKVGRKTGLSRTRPVQWLRARLGERFARGPIGAASRSDRQDTES